MKCSRDDTQSRRFGPYIGELPCTSFPTLSHSGFQFRNFRAAVALYSRPIRIGHARIGLATVPVPGRNRGYLKISLSMRTTLQCWPRVSSQLRNPLIPRESGTGSSVIKLNFFVATGSLSESFSIVWKAARSIPNSTRSTGTLAEGPESSVVGLWCLRQKSLYGTSVSMYDTTWSAIQSRTDSE